MSRLQSLFARADDPYAGVDLANAARLGGMLWFVGAALTLVMLPAAPPDAELGGIGWAVAALVVAGGIAAGARMRVVGERVNVAELLVFSYAAVASVAVLVWLSGGVGSPYAQLFVLSAIYTSAVHPPRRALPYFAVFVVAVLSPVAYADPSRRELAELVAQLTVWLALSLLAMVLMRVVRSQRLGLRREGDAARRQARLDPLTGLLNRRAFDETLADEVALSHASRRPLSVVVGDIDDFKAFNDRFGHIEGDRVLRLVAESLRTAVRRPDAAYRWGGDEFAVILPDTDRRGAQLVAERIAAAVTRNSGPAGEPLTMATGVAELEEDAAAPDALVTAADRALLEAKAADSSAAPG